MLDNEFAATEIMPPTCEAPTPIVIRLDGSIAEKAVSPEEAEFLRGWQPCTRPTGIDVAESERVGRKIRAVSKQCWFNARKSVMKLDDYAQASYVEGYAICKDGFGPIEHGWVVKDGLIIDPTLPNDVGWYFAGLEFVGRAGIEEFLATARGKKCRKSPFFFAFGWGGQKNPSMASAYEESFDYFKQIHRIQEASR